MATTKTVTAMGIKVKIDKDVFDDLEVFELIGKINDGDVFAFPKLTELIFGNEYEKICKQLEDPKTGKVKVSVFTEFITELMNQLGDDSKN